CAENSSRPARFSASLALRTRHRLPPLGLRPRGMSIHDQAVLDLANSDRRAIVTLNPWHLVRLHAERPTDAGIIVCTFELDFIALARRIGEVIRRVGSLDGQLVRVNRPSR